MGFSRHDLVDDLVQKLDEQIDTIDFKVTSNKESTKLAAGMIGAFLVGCLESMGQLEKEWGADDIQVLIASSLMHNLYANPETRGKVEEFFENFDAIKEMLKDKGITGQES